MKIDTLRITLILFLSFLSTSLFILPDISEGVYFASDIVMLYEGDIKINDNSVIFLASYKRHSVKCEKGLCSIGQQFYPVTIYKTKSNSTLTYGEFVSQHPYQGGEHDGRAKDIWSAQLTEDYLRYLEENSSYHLSFNPGSSKGGEDCGYPGCIGGRIGNKSHTQEGS